MDVDYTVLAGTSVLTDLIEKCPPAEACRDAFDRMSRATINMCQATTGFGSQVKFNRQTQDDSPVLPDDLDVRAPPKPAYIGTRPPPEFDCNLKDLFSQQTQGAQTWSNLSQSMQPTTKQSQIQPFSYPSPASTSSSIPPSNHVQMAPQQQQHYDPRLMDQTMGAMPMIVQPNGVVPNDGYDFTNNPDFDFLMNHDAMTDSYTGDNGLNLGFEDGAQIPDLFEGFFFGGPALDGNGVFNEADALGGMNAASTQGDVWARSGRPS